MEENMGGQAVSDSLVVVEKVERVSGELKTKLDEYAAANIESVLPLRQFDSSALANAAITLKLLKLSNA